MGEVIYDYDVVMFMVRHISPADGSEMDEMKKVKIVIDFLDNNKMKTHDNALGSQRCNNECLQPVV